MNNLSPEQQRRVNYWLKYHESLTDFEIAFAYDLSRSYLGPVVRAFLSLGFFFGITTHPVQVNVLTGLIYMTDLPLNHPLLNPND